MIKNLHISNFQSHKKTNLDFPPGVTVIVGPSDSGKTAVLRALDWVINNRPLGDSFRRMGSEKTIVQIQVPDNIISRIKSNTENRYGCASSDKIGAEFKALKSDIPPEISNTLNFAPINIQRQMDAPFLLANNSGEVARYFNKIANIDKIDSGISYCTKQINDQSRKIVMLSDRVEKTKEELEKLAFVDEMEKDVELLEEMQKEAEQLQIQAQDIQTVINRMNIQQTQLAKIEKVPVDQIQNALDLIQDLKTTEEIKQSQAADIKSILDNLSGYRLDIHRKEEELERLEKKYHELKPETCPLCGQRWES